MKHLLIIILLGFISSNKILAQQSLLVESTYQAIDKISEQSKQSTNIKSPEYKFDEYTFSVSVFYKEKQPFLIIEKSNFNNGALLQQTKYYLSDGKIILQESSTLERNGQNYSEQHIKHFYYEEELKEAYLVKQMDSTEQRQWETYTPIIPEDPNRVEWLLQAANLTGEFEPKIKEIIPNKEGLEVVMKTQGTIAFEFSIHCPEKDETKINISDAIIHYKDSHKQKMVYSDSGH